MLVVETLVVFWPLWVHGANQVGQVAAVEATTADGCPAGGGGYGHWAADSNSSID
jgi:hypothetical protein